MIFAEPQQYDERVSVAEACSTNLKIELPIIVDTMGNTTETAYTAWPDRLYVIDKNGRVAFKSDAGPFGFKTELLSNAIEKVLELNPDHTKK